MTEPHEPQGSARFVDDQNRYRLDARIATGGMGEVWRATDTFLDRAVAVKILKSEYADDPLFRSRFETEAQHAASLHHPGVAAVFDVGESAVLGREDGSGIPRPFLVMELVDGQPLSALLRGGRALDPEAVRHLIALTAAALGAAHRAGIVHRDVKPANLIVTGDRQVKITDFGIARASDGLGLTGTGQVMGTPQYLSPEQARGETATPASDVYSLGVVAFECLAGYRPFEAGSAVATALAHLNDPVPDLPPTVPADLAAVVRRAMAKNPAERYTDGDDFAAALQDPTRAAAAIVAPHAPAPFDDEVTQVLGVPAAVPAPGPATGPIAMTDERTAERSNRTAWWAVAAVAAVVLAVVVLLIALNGRGDDDPTAPATTGEPTPTAPTTSDVTTPSEPTSSEPAPVEINEADYLGRPVDVVATELRAKGLEVETRPIDNPGNKDADTVASVRPTTGLVEGDTVTVEYYREAEPTTAPPTKTPTTQSPTQTSEPTTAPPTSTQPSSPTTTTEPAGGGSEPADPTSATSPATDGSGGAG